MNIYILSNHINFSKNEGRAANWKKFLYTFIYTGKSWWAWTDNLSSFTVNIDNHSLSKGGSDWTEVIDEETEPTAYYHDSYLTGILHGEGQDAVSAAVVAMENNLAVSSERGVLSFTEPESMRLAAGW